VREVFFGLILMGFILDSNPVGAAELNERDQFRIQANWMKEPHTYVLVSVCRGLGARPLEFDGRTTDLVINLPPTVLAISDPQKAIERLCAIRPRFRIDRNDDARQFGVDIEVSLAMNDGRDLVDTVFDVDRGRYRKDKRGCEISWSAANEPIRGFVLCPSRLLARYRLHRPMTPVDGQSVAVLVREVLSQMSVVQQH
jgi:hypothetical protein